MIRRQILGILILTSSMNGLLATPEPAQNVEKEKKESTYWDIVTDYVLPPVALIGGIFFLHWAWKKAKANIQHAQQRDRARNRARGFVNSADYSGMEGKYDFANAETFYSEENQQVQRESLEKTMKERIAWLKQHRNPNSCNNVHMDYVPSHAGKGDSPLFGVLTITDGPNGLPYIFVAYPSCHTQADQEQLRDHLLNHLQMEGMRPTPRVIDLILKTMAR